MKKTYIIFLFCLISNLSMFLVKPNKNKENNLSEKNNIVNTITLEGETIKFDDYLIGVVSCEMPASFNIEALKAMAVAARTFALNKIYNNSNYNFSKTISDQCFSDEESLKNKWQDDYDFYFNKVKSAVEYTKNEYISYEDKPIKAYYFSTSNGYTENASSVFGSNESYLKSVNSSWDKESKPYYFVKEINISEFINTLNLNTNNITISNIIRNSTNHVDNITINDKTYTGITIRKLFNLKSTDFVMDIKDNKVIFTTYGYGHGVGMSQYGANYLANNGYDYKYILNYYYKNTLIKNV